MASNIFSTPASAEIIRFPPSRVFRTSELVSALKGSEACITMLMSGNPLQMALGQQALAENERIIALHTVGNPSPDNSRAGGRR